MFLKIIFPMYQYIHEKCDFSSCLAHKNNGNDKNKVIIIILPEDKESKSLMMIFVCQKGSIVYLNYSAHIHNYFVNRHKK